MQFKRIFAVILSIALGLFVPAASVFSAYDDQSPPITVELFDFSQNQNPVDLLAASSAAAGLFLATAPIDAIEVNCPAWSASPGDGAIYGLSISIYEWAGDYDATLAGNALFSQDFPNYGDGEFLRLDTINIDGDPLPADAEYLYVLHDGYKTQSGPSGEGGAGTWLCPARFPYNVAFVNGAIVAGSLRMRVYYAHTPSPLLELPSVTPPKLETTVQYFDATNGHDPVTVTGSSTMAGLFAATENVVRFGLECPNYNGGANFNGTVSLALYAWKGSYEETLAGEKLYDQAFPGYADNATLWCYTPDLGPGEYLYVLYGGNAGTNGGNVGVWVCNSYSDYMVTFMNGSLALGKEARLHVTYEDTPSPYKTAPSYSIKIPDGLDLNPSTAILATYNLGDDPGAMSSAHMMTKGDSIASLFSATGHMTSVEICCPSFTSSTSHLTLSLYAWDTDYETTTAAAPLYFGSYPNYGDCTWLTLGTISSTGNICPPGEYLLVVDALTSACGTWLSNTISGYQTLFFGGTMAEGDFSVRLNYFDSPEPLRQKPSYNIDSILSTPAKGANPPAPYPSDHPIYALDAMPDTWAAVDGLGRILPTYEEAPLKTDGQTRQVGLFYWTWHVNSNLIPVNVQKLLDYNAGLDKNNFLDSIWQPNGPSVGYQYFTNEPMFGFYDSNDEWVYRRHAEMLADAGVDVVIFDNTNGTLTWRSSYQKLLKAFDQARKDGVKTPQIAFLLPFGPGDNSNSQLIQLYLDIYRDGKYQDLWYYWKGKPLIMAHPDSLGSGQIAYEIKEFFSFRPGQPVYGTQGSNAQPAGNSSTGYGLRWDWLSIYPQRRALNKDGTIEQMAVGTAMNWTWDYRGTDPGGTGGVNYQGLTAMNGTNIMGRTFYKDGNANMYDTQDNAILYGANLAQQFEYAIEQDPEFIFITGWNEGCAGRYKQWPPEAPDNWQPSYPGETYSNRTNFTVANAFPDQFNDEFSRDIQPSTGQLRDHYYYQMASYIRQYKGVRPQEAASGKLDAAPTNWDSVAPTYRSYKNNIDSRDTYGYGEIHFVNETGRNDLVLAKLAHDDDNLYFMVQSQNALSPYTDPDWMRLFISTNGFGADNWEGYNYILNKNNPTAQKATLEAANAQNAWSWTEIGTVDYAVAGNTLVVTIPKAMLGISGDDFTIDFKWSDNTLAAERGHDILDFYEYGDTAPGGRFNYRYTAKTGEATVDFVEIIPIQTTLDPGESFGFAAIVKGENNPSQKVSWSLSGNNSSGTFISSAGTLTIAASESSKTLLITAVSEADSAVYGTATVNVGRTATTSYPTLNKDVPYGKPPVDGLIDGIWSQAAQSTVDRNNALAWTGAAISNTYSSGTLNYRMMWSEEGLYVAMDITRRTGNIVLNNGANPNATHGDFDKIQLGINPGNVRQGYENPIWFTFSAMAGGALHVVREDGNGGGSLDISDLCTGKTTVATTKLTVTALIPWDVINIDSYRKFDPKIDLKSNLHIAYVDTASPGYTSGNVLSPRNNSFKLVYSTNATDNAGRTGFSCLDQPLTLTLTKGAAEFEIEVATESGGTVTGAGTYYGGENVTLRATADRYYYFDGWYEDDILVSTEAQYTFTATANTNVTAHFEAKIPVSIGDASFISIVETSKNSRVWVLTFIYLITYSDDETDIATETIYLEGNNANLDGEYAFSEGDLAGYTLIYDIKGNGSNIKSFEIVKK